MGVVRVKRSRENSRWVPIRKVSREMEDPRWIMRCSCGVIKRVLWRSYVSGRSLSCGCYAREINSAGIGKYKLPAGESARRQLLLVYKRYAKRARRAFKLSRKRFFELTSSNCHYCNHPPHQVIDKRTVGSNGVCVYNGIDRMDSAKGYISENCVPCCRMCNYAKRNMPYDAFILWLDKLVLFRINKDA